MHSDAKTNKTALIVQPLSIEGRLHNFGSLKNGLNLGFLVSLKMCNISHCQLKVEVSNILWSLLTITIRDYTVDVHL